MMNNNLKILWDYPQLCSAVLSFAERIGNATLRKIFVQCSLNTLTTTVKQAEDDVYLITGDINAMWLRDSSAQVMHYLELAPDAPDVGRLVKGLVRRQMRYILRDPYANAFNFEPNGKGHPEDETDRKDPIVFERKFELDSLCYPIFLACNYCDKTGDGSIFDKTFFEACGRVLDTFETEQRHHERSEYFHYRPTEAPELSVPGHGRGGRCAVTGMVWSGYRPSDDPCTYAYFIPGNMFVAVTMRRLAQVSEKNGEQAVAVRAAALAEAVEKGIRDHATVRHPKFGTIYAFETDGLGNYNLMDDANVPSLLGLPYIGWCGADDEIYQNTRRFVLSEENPWYHSGKALSGIGSPHTPGRYVWPISLMMEGLTETDAARVNEIVKILASTTDGTGYMHESVHADDASDYSRPWFAWANSLFSYFLIRQADKIDCIRNHMTGGKIMKKSSAVLAAVLAGVMAFSVTACTENGEKDPGTTPPPTETTLETLYERADYLARGVDDHYATYESDGVSVVGYYNAIEGGTDALANCYEYSSLIDMALRLYITSTTEAQKTYYKTLLDGYVDGLRFFEGSGEIMSTHGTRDWEGLYNVYRNEIPNTGNVSTDMVYDDLMWLIRAFVEIEKATGDASYITRAEHLAKACLDGWDSTKGGIGGITWGPTYNSKHTCSNAPFIIALCGLAEYYKDSDAKVTAEDTVYVEQTFGQEHVEWENMVGWSKYDYYLYWAKAVYDFTYSYLRASDYTFADNLRHDRNPVTDANATGGGYWYFDPYTGSSEGSKYTYNVGAMISGAAGLYGLTGDETYLTQGRMMAEGAYDYFVKTVEVDGQEMQMYDCRTTLLFNSVLMQGYLDLADVCKEKAPAQNDEIQQQLATFVKPFKTSINYAFDNYLLNRTLPHNYLQGWLYADSGSGGADTFDTHKDVKDAAATPIILAMLVQYENNHGML